MRSCVRLASILAFLLLPGSAFAQQTIGFRAYVIVDADSIASTQSFKAVLGTSRLTAFGGGGEVDLWKNLFVRVAATRARKTGSRVFVDNGQVFPMNIPLTLTLTPVEIGGGWRFPIGSARTTITPYAGASFVSLGYKEVSQHADPSENSDVRYSGAEGFGGVEIGLLKWLVVAAEAQYRNIPNALSAGGASSDFHETELGGFSARVTIGFRSIHP